MDYKKYIDKFIAVTGSFLDKLIGILLPLRFPLMYRGTDIEEFKRLMSWMWDKNLDNLLRCIDIYVGINLDKELKNKMSWNVSDDYIVEKMQWVAAFKETIATYVQTRSVQR